MYLFITILIVIFAIILIFLVVIQNSKGGGLAAGFSSSNQVMGVRKTTDFLEKATWSFAGSIVALCVVASLFIPRSQTTKDSSIRDQIQNTVPVTDPNAVPDFGTSEPEEESEPAPTE
jgi:preprotein translocase subunit SecG